MKFLDLSGLQYFFDKIKNRLKSYYGTCTTSASTQAKVVECEGFKLETGAKIAVKFTNAQTYNGTATLNVNGTGAKNICRVGTTTTTRYYWSAGEVVDFVYDGTNYVMEGKGVATTTYYGVTKLSSSTSSTSTSLAATPSAVKTAYDLANTANTQATANATDIGTINTNISTINTTLGNKQDALVSGTNIKTINGTSLLGSGNIAIEGGGGGLPTLSSPVRIWDLEPGTYVTAEESTTIYYDGATSTSSFNLPGKNALLIVYNATNAADVVYRQFIAFGGASGLRYCYNGFARSDYGEYEYFDFTRSYLTSISKYVKNNLTYTTSSTTYALSAYQGYLLDQRLKALEACPYDVGDLYITTNNTDPNTKWSGTTWVQIKDTFLLACGDKYGAGTTGGEEKVTLKIEEMPRHAHPQYVTANANSGGTAIREDYTRDSTGSTRYLQGADTGEVGGNQPHNNMPPYLAVYVWKRTA